MSRTRRGEVQEFVVFAAANPRMACREWPYRRNADGYGGVRWRGKWERAHRVVWEVASGQPVPPGLCVLHSCDNPPCVNPSHLFAGTKKENHQDMVRKGRQGDQRQSERQGAAHPMARLTEDQAVAVALDNRPQRQVAAQYGISRSLVGQIRRGEKWAHLRKVAGE